MISLKLKTESSYLLRKRFPKAITFDGLNRIMKPEVVSLVQKLKSYKIKGDRAAVEKAATLLTNIENPNHLFQEETIRLLSENKIDIFLGEGEIYLISQPKNEEDLFSLVFEGNHPTPTQTQRSKRKNNPSISDSDIYDQLHQIQTSRAKIWKNEAVEIPKEISQGVAELLEIRDPRVNFIISQIVVKRGINNQSSFSQFVRPQTESPRELPNVELAAKTIIDLMKKGRKITIYGDYDVDGIIGTSILVNALRDLKAKVDYYIPHRLHDGFGLSMETLKKIKSEGLEGLISVDCGTSALEELKALSNWGIKFVITDHHLPPTGFEDFTRELKAPLPIVNPRFLPETHPSSNICGATTAFKLAQLVYKMLGKDPATFEKNNLGLIAIATIADVVPLLGENRAIVKNGLETLSNMEPFSIKVIRKEINLEEISTSAIAFGIAPMVNALGRLQDANPAVELFISKNRRIISKRAKELRKVNEKRKEIEKQILKSALTKISLEYPDLSQANALVLWDESWHEGVIGIDASRLVEIFGLPTLLFSIASNKAKGSGRSTSEVNLYQALEKSAKYLTKWGGHQVAAGFSMEAETSEELHSKLLLFRENFSKSINEIFGGFVSESKILIDCEINLSDIEETLLSGLRLLEPYGSGNPQPQFLTKNLYFSNLRNSINGEHLHLTLFDRNAKVNAVGWKKRHLTPVLRKTGRVDIVFNLALNSWRKDRSQIEIVDLKENNGET